MPPQTKKSGKPSPIASAATNRFSALLLDEGSSREPEATTIKASEPLEAACTASKGKEEKKEKGAEEDVVVAASAASSATTGRPSSTSSTPTPRLRKPLFWLDLEMTGLDPTKDSILEIAVVASDGLDLDVRIPGPSVAISTTEEKLETMNGWCVEHHGSSGLTAKCLDPERSVSLEEAERQVCEFVERHRTPPREARRKEDVGGGNGGGGGNGNGTENGGDDDNDGKTPPPPPSSSSPPPPPPPPSPSFPPRMVQDRATLAGNSIHVDFGFLRVHMPRLASLCSHRLVDVSSFAEVARRWHPSAFYSSPSKQNAHEALKDVYDSIDELKFYKEVMFKSSGEVSRAAARMGNPRNPRRGG